MIQNVDINKDSNITLTMMSDYVFEIVSSGKLGAVEEQLLIKSSTFDATSRE